MQPPSAEYAAKISSLIQAYIAETGSPATVEEFAGELSIAPITVLDALIGFWGLVFKESKTGRVAVIKAFYLVPEHRGRLLNSVTDDLIRGLTAVGVKHMEVWAFPAVQSWLNKRYGIKPIAHVSFDPIEKYQIYDDHGTEGGDE